MVDVFVSRPKPAARRRRSSAPSSSAKPTKSKNWVRYETVAEKLKDQRQFGKMRGFNILPKKARFETQDDQEKIILLLRQHWVTQLGSAILAVLMLFLPLTFNFLPVTDFLPPNYRFMIVLIWYLLVIAFVYEKFISWFFHVFIVTDERVIDIDFYNLLYKQVSEAKIDNIEDVTYTQGGVLRALFDYGDVGMQTSAEKRQFEIESVPQPNRVVQILNELKMEEEQEKIEGRVR